MNLESKTFSSVMRELRAQDPNMLEKFLAQFKKSFDQACESQLENPEQAALMEALYQIDDSKS